MNVLGGALAVPILCQDRIVYGFRSGAVDAEGRIVSADEGESDN